MKKIGILLLCLPLFTAKIRAAQLGFTWVDTVIEVPLGENIEPYLEIPFAVLNDNLSDPSMYYEKNGINYTFISTINTSVLKTYKLDFKVYSPKYRISSVQTILFKIIDTEAPVIIKGLIIEVPVKSINVNYLNYIDYKDNHDIKSDIKVVIDSFSINLNQVGFYKVHIKLIDLSLNQSDYELLVHVKDYQSPTINEKENLLMNIGDKTDLMRFFIIKDNYDLSPDIIIDDSAVIYDVIGKYPIRIDAYDQSANHNYLETILEIKDIEKPVLALKSTSIELPLGDTFELSTLIIKVSDNYDDLSLSNVLISTDLDIHNVGFYEAIYELSDSSKNQTTIKVDIYVRDLEKPVFEIDSIITTEFENIDLMHDVYVKDNSNKRVKWTLVETNIQNKSGTYQALYLAIDEAGNHTYHVREIVILGQENNYQPVGTIIFFVVAGIGLVGISLFGFYYYKLTKSKRSI